jgi:hypothetical protein
MNGDIWLESELDKGSTFFVSFPIQENPPDTLEPLDSKVIQSPSEAKIK